MKNFIYKCQIKKEPPVKAAPPSLLTEKNLLNYNPAHGQAVAISVNNLNPIQTFSKSPHINIHPVVRSSNGIVL